MSGFIGIMKSLEEGFHKYAAKDGDPNSMTREEAIAMLRAEFKVPDDVEVPEAVLQGIDVNRDGLVHFHEFALFASAIFLCSDENADCPPDTCIGKSFKVLKDNFREYAKRDGDCSTLNMQEMTALMRAGFEDEKLECSVPECAKDKMDTEKLTFQDFVMFLLIMFSSICEGDGMAETQCKK